MEVKKKIRWGLLGAGEIVHRWIKGAKQFDDMEIVAVASRSLERATQIAQQYQIAHAMTYEEMLECAEIDVVYIPVPHPAHKDLAIRAMQHGKAVLVEKPAAINAEEFRQMVEAAKENRVFMMEAVWTHFFPLIKQIHSFIGEDGIGQIRAMNMAFSFRTSGVAKENRLLDPKKAGGGLLDTGVYNLHFTQMLLNKNPVELYGMAAIDTDEHHLQIDEQASYIARYDHGELVTMSSGVRTNMIDTAYIYGTKGYIIVPHFWKPVSMQVVLKDKKIDVIEEVLQRIAGVEDEGYQYEIAHVNQCLRDGCIESPIVTWKKSMNVLEQCDQLRTQWGLHFPI